MTLFTIGHGTRTTEELASTLLAAGVPTLVDVRRFPGSRRSPHLSREALSQDLPDLGVAYEWQGEALGGRRRSPAQRTRHPAWRNDAFRAYADYMDTAEFRDALTALLDRPPLAVMCAETLFWRCHRRLIADAATVRGVPVVHLLAPGEQQPHVLTDGLRVGDDGWPVYDVGAQQEFPHS